LEPRYSFLRALKRTTEVRSFCGVIVDGTKCSFGLSAEALRLFTEVDIEMEVSLIFGGYSDEESPGSTSAESEEQLPETDTPPELRVNT